jgi:peptidoglycan lytic transglycosylase
MNRIPGYLMAAAVGLASMGASPPPPDRQDQKVPLKASVSTSTPKVTARQKRQRKPYQVGTASWYGRYFHGRPTASGEPYDMFALTAAHRTLKLGTWVRVTNLRNGKSVLVRVNDRGPVPQSRIIDLSFEAATVLDFRARGLEKVRVDVVEPETVALALKLRSLP